MAPPTSTTALATTRTSSDNLSFPFTKLPAELRLKIYRFALQATIDTVMLEPIYPTYRGTLALLHVSKMLRFESARELLPIAVYYGTYDLSTAIMATPSSTTTTSNSTTTTTSAYKPSPTFEGLPAELRLQIYRTSLQDTIDKVLARDRFPPGWLEYRGALALLHINSKFRAESAPEMLPIVEVEFTTLGRRWQDLDEDIKFAEYEWPSAYEYMKEERGRACERRNAMAEIKAMLEKCLACSFVAAD